MTECTCEAKDMPFGRCCKAPTLEEVTAQRDKLIEALKGLVAISNDGCIGPWNVARQAIAECERK